MARYVVRDKYGDQVTVDTNKNTGWWEAARLYKTQTSNRLYKSSKDNYYTVTSYATDHIDAEILTDEEAADWLIMNEYTLPEDLSNWEREIE